MRHFVGKLAYLSLLITMSISLVGCKKDPSYDIHTEDQAAFLSGEYKLISIYADGKKEASKPVPVTLNWDEFGDKNYKFYLSKDSEFNVIDATYECSSNYISLENLEINTNYYWYVSSDNKDSKVKKFSINNQAPRNLNIDGLTNARDLGGYKTSDGSYTNQGLIYRTSRLNENETTTNLITEKGISEMKDHLKIKSELDIRRTDNNENGGITTSPLGSDVNYYSIPMRSGGNCILLNKDVLKDAFKILGQKENYPIVIHCSIGTDRTGMLCFLINALLDVGEDDLYRDYLFSNFGNIGGSRFPSTIKDYLKTLNNADGNTIKEQAFNYLINVGVQESDINQLIEIMK